MRQFGIYDFFDCLRTSDDVKRVKPDPELYLSALSGLGIDASEAVAFEDSLNGLNAAVAAGIYTVVVPNSVTAHLPFQGHALRLGSMEERELAAIIRLAETRTG